MTNQPIATARKVTMPQARRAYRAGATLVVTERPQGDTINVYPTTTTNRPDRTSWDELHGMVLTWRNRYPRQTFYVLEEN